MLFLPEACLVADLIDDPLSDGYDESALLGKGQELGRKQQSSLGVITAQKCLHTNEFTGRYL